MPTISPASASTTPFPTASARTVDGVTHIDLNFASVMSKGSGTIFVTDGAVQTVIDRVTGQPKLRVVGGTFSKEISLDKLSFSGTHVMFDVAGLPLGAKPNVYMGAGTLLSGGKAAPAITVPGSVVFTTPSAEPPPALTATITLDSASLKSGEDIVVTIIFNKPVTELPPGSLVAGNASISYLSASEDGKTWSALLTGVAATDAPTNVVRLNMDSVVAADGTQGSGVAESPPYLVDTLVAAYVDSIGLVNDSGALRDDGISNEDDMNVSGLLYGSLKAGESIELTINGRIIDPSKIQVSSTYSSGVYKWSYANETEHFNLGGNTVQVRVVGGGHSSQTLTETILIDQNAPGIVSRPTAPISATGAIRIVFNEAMHWDDNVEVTHDIRVVDAFGNTSWIDLEESHLSIDGKTLTLSAADHKLASGNNYAIHLPWDLTDLAGNRYDGPAINVSTSGPYQDKAPPRLLQTYIVNGDGSYGTGDVLEFRLRFSEKVNLQAGIELKLYLSNGKFATYMGLANDGTEMSFSYTIGAGEDSNDLDTYTVWQVAGKVHDDAGNVMQNWHIEYDGSLTTEDGYGAMVSIDTVVAKPGTPRLHATSDTGTVGDLVTEDATPLLAGSGAEAGATVSLWIGDEKIGSATVDLDGRWDTVIASPLAVGTHQIRAIQEDRAGNVSELSDPLSLTIVASTTPPSLSAPVLDAASDTGASGSDRITMLDQPTIRGTGPANATLKLKQNGLEIATVTTDASGNWDYTLPSLADGSHSFTVQQGETGPGSAALSITVDGSNPSVGPEWSEVVADFDLGRDLVISFSEAVHIEASEGEDDMLVLVDENDNIQKIAVSNANLSGDKRTLTISSADHNLLALTDYRVQLPTTLTDLAGNGMGEYHIWFRTGNDALPSAVRAVVNGDGSYAAGETITIRVRFSEQVEKFGESGLSLGLSNNLRAVFTSMGGIANDEALFSYTVAPGNDYTDVRIIDTSELVGRFADLSGNLLDGAHISLNDLYDGSGNGARIDIDTVAPSAPGRPVLAAASDSGDSNSDGITNVAMPTFSGSDAEPGATIVLYADTREIGRKTVDDAGNWSLTVLDVDKFTTDGSYAITARQIDRAGNTSDASPAFTLVFDSTAPVLTAFANDRNAKEFALTFNDQIFFNANGVFRLMQNDTERRVFKGNDPSNWDILTSTEGKYILNLEIGMNGTFKLVMDNVNGVQDRAGNAAVIVGTPVWDIINDA